MMLRGRPILVDFLGFKSDTYRLQSAGWQISESKDEYRNEFRIAIRHPQHTSFSGMSAPIDRSRIMAQIMRYAVDMEEITIRLDVALPYIIERQFDMPSPAFIPVDATPHWATFDLEEVDLWNEPYFQPIEEGREVFLRRATIDEIMQIALDKQEPEQARIREERRLQQRRDEYKRGGTIEAKLIAV